MSEESKLGVRVEVDAKSGVAELDRFTEAEKRVGAACAAAAAGADQLGKENSQVADSAINAAREEDRLASSALPKAESAARGAASASDDLAKKNNNAANSGKSHAAVTEEMVGKLKSLAAAYVGINGVGKLLELADEAQLLDGRLRLVTESEREFQIARQETRAIAEETRSDLSATIELYTKMAPAIREAGGSQRDALDLTRSFSQALKISGASAQEAASATLQFAQALASGRFQGDELRAVLESSPRFAKALADGLGVTRGELRKMGEDGKLTTAVILEAIQSQGPKLEAEMRKIPPTLSDVRTRAGNELLQLIQDFNQSEGAVTSLAETIQGLVPAIEPTFNLVGGLAQAFAAGIRSAFNVVTALVRGTVANVADAAGLIAEAMSKITFGDVSKGFSEAATSLKNRANELREGIKQDFADIEASGDQVNRGMGRAAAGIVELATGTERASEIAKQSAAEVKAAAEAAAQSVEKTAKAAVSAADEFAKAKEQAGEASKGAKAAGEELRKFSEESLKGYAEKAASDIGQLQLRVADLRKEFPQLGTAAAAAVPEASKQFDDLNKEIEKARDVLNQVRVEQLRRLGVDAGEILTGVRNKFQDSIDAVKSLGANSTTTAREMTAAFEGALEKAKTREEALALAEAVRGVKIQGFDAAGAVKEIALAAKALPAATEQLTLAARAARALGLDIREAQGGISDGFAKVTANIAALASDLRVQSPILREQIDKALSTAKNEAEIKSLEAAIIKAFAAGSLSAADYEASLAKANLRQRELAESVSDTASAFQELGIKSSAQLQIVADRASAAFERIRSDARSTQGDIDRAFESMAQKALEAARAANDGSEETVKAMLESKAATDAQAQAVAKLTERYNESGDAAQRMGNKAIEAFNAARAAGQSITESFRAAAETLKGLQGQIDITTDKYEQLRRAANAARQAESAQQYDQNGFAVNPDGSIQRAVSQATPGREAEQLMQYYDQLNRSFAFQGPRIGVEQVERLPAYQAALARDREYAEKNNTVVNGFTSGPSKTVNVNLTLGGKSVTGVFPDNASTVTFINTLQQAQRNA